MRLFKRINYDIKPALSNHKALIIGMVSLALWAFIIAGIVVIFT